MKRTQLSAIAFVVAAAFTAPAMAVSDTAVTRDQVKAELAQAVQAGNMLVSENGETYREAFPQNYPSQQPVASVTREQVKAELAEAVEAGHLLVSENGETYKDVYPHNYPDQQTASKTREQVKAELAQAIESGAHQRRIEA